MNKLYLLLLFCVCLVKANAQPGSLDPSFGKNGIQYTTFFNNVNVLNEQGRVILAGDNRKIFIVVQVGNLTRIAKYLPDGNLDFTYGNKGYSNEVNLSVSSAMMQATNIVIAGSINTDFALFRYTANGGLDSSFGNNGRVTTDISGDYDYANSVILQGDKIIVGGSAHNPNTGYDFAVVRYTADGVLDSSFGKNGKVTTDINGSDDGATAVILQGDKIIAVGPTYNFNTGNTDFALARYTANGVLDSSFGNNGRVITDNGSATSVILQGNKIIAGGSDVDSNNGYTDFALARYTANGILDSSFGENGIVTTDISGGAVANSVLFQGDKIIAGGYTGYYSNFALARYTADGKLDSSFGNNGIVTTDISESSDDIAQSVIFQGDKIIAGGFTRNPSDLTTDFALVRYTVGGRLDSSFGKNGIITGYFPSGRTVFTSTAVQSDKIIAAGYTLKALNDNDFALARYTADGVLDPSFGENGKVITDINGSSDDDVQSIIFQGDKIVVAGSANNPNTGSDFALARYTADGILDSSFGENGKVTTNIIGSEDYGRAMALQGDKIIVAGNSATFLSVYALARYTADGKLDSSFGNNGIVITEVSREDNARSLILQGDKIIVAGYTAIPVNEDFNIAFALVRYTADGRLDSSFGNNGIVLTGFSHSNGANSIILQGEKIIAGGFTNNGDEIELVRYTSDGVLDSSFGKNAIVATPIRAYIDDVARSMALQGDKIIVAGTAIGINDSFALVRYNQDGTLDSSFAENGIQITNFDGSAILHGMALHGNRLYAVGGIDLQSGEIDGVIAAYQLESSVVLTCPGNKTVSTDSGLCKTVMHGIDPILTPADSTASITYTTSGATTKSGKGSASGRSFQKGVTTIKYSLSGDPAQTCSFTITVQDKEAPVLTNANASPFLLLPPDHQMKLVTVNYSLSDNCGATTSLWVSSSEGESGTGPGDLSPDWQVVEHHHLH